MSMSHMQWSISDKYDEGMAVATEYVLLLGVSLVIFAAMYIGCNSFYHTAAADARAQSAREIALEISNAIEDVSASGMNVDWKLSLPPRLNGAAYIVYPAEEGAAIYVMDGRSHGSVYRAPLLQKNMIRVEGFIMSEPGEHRIIYDNATRTVTIS